MPNFTQIRYYLEIISVPIFAWLVVHLAGHGLMLLAEGGHEEHGHGGHESLLSLETVLGLAALIIFVWIWHRPQLKPLVPCSHDHCHHKSLWPHLAASVAFVIHLFPESELRHQFLENFSADSLFSLVGMVGFATHFLVDAIIIILLSQYWKTTWQKVASLIVMIGFWLGALWSSESMEIHLEGVAEPVLLLVSAFLLTMFVHKPHRPEPVCTSC